MSSAAYFDVDGTLVSTNLIPPTLRFFSNQASPLKSLKRLGMAVLDGSRMALAELQDRRKFNEILYSHYKGMSRDRMEILAVEIFEDILKPAIFPGAIELIATCKRAGQRVVLVTGSLDVTTKHLAKHLGADSWIANRLEYKERKATGKLLQPVVAGPEKSALIVNDAAQNGHNLQLCHGYSDSFSDVPMLSIVGSAFCINPDKKLKRLAQAYRWPIIDITKKTHGPRPPQSRSK
jgi:HAD superfamily hydrolase (TIGR01490 family)